jgi:hypothetical protein
MAHPSSKVRAYFVMRSRMAEIHSRGCSFRVKERTRAGPAFPPASLQPVVAGTVANPFTCYLAGAFRQRLEP